MTQNEMFGNAKWVCAGKYETSDSRKVDPSGNPWFPVLMGHFTVSAGEDVTLRAVGLGFFHVYINGKPVTAQRDLPLSTDYELRPNEAVGEVFTGHRLYVPEYNITALTHEGDNTIVIHFGGGWYTFIEGRFGDPKAIYAVFCQKDGNTKCYGSSEDDIVTDSYIKTYYLSRCEHQNYNGWDDALLSGTAPSCASKAVPAKEPQTDYLFTDCPGDILGEELPFRLVTEKDGVRVYDCTKNMAGIPILHLPGGIPGKTTVNFSEMLNEEGMPHPGYQFEQCFSVESDGTERDAMPMFTWFGFRYFSVEGPGTPVSVRTVHSDVAINSSFTCQNQILNNLYKVYLNTQQSNMHTGIPSDCAHIERRGYTGDGQLTCHAAMDMFGAKEFYKKWIDDISDCQDVITGHVQYTAPYLHSGGGPGGWGCAIVEVPYQYYLHYGDAEPFRRLYPQMLKYFEYLEAHSSDNLIISDRPGEWCLGDWCVPVVVILPAPFVNNYFYIRSMERCLAMADIIGNVDVDMLSERIAARRKATTNAYLNAWDGKYLGSVQGADAFALDMGIGNSRSINHLLNHYAAVGGYDTGIFGTEVVTRKLFELGYQKEALDLLLSESKYSFSEFWKQGATTLWEYWPNDISRRSLNHPMFGAVTACLFDYLLGIGQKTGEGGYKNIVIRPYYDDRVGDMSGSRTLPSGIVSVSVRKTDRGITVDTTIPPCDSAVLIWGDKEFALKSGTCHTEIDA